MQFLLYYRHQKVLYSKHKGKYLCFIAFVQYYFNEKEKIEICLKIDFMNIKLMQPL